jgi:hypothetical protein
MKNKLYYYVSGRYSKYLLLLLMLIFLSVQVNAQGTWSKVSNTSPNGSGGLMLLLSDGTVMAKSSAGGGSGNIWMKLTPDIHGSYANGTWSNLTSSISDRLYFSSQVLKDGRVYVAGGEYGAGGTLGEIYNPLTNTWTALPTTGHTFSDANSEILPDGRVLQALVEGSLTTTLIYDPVSNQYTNGPSSHGIMDESAWVKLPDNSILMIDRDTRNSERYIPSLNQWVVDANLPVDIYDPFGSEAGAAFALPDGRAFFIGSTGSTAYYNPSGNNNPGSWTAGPTIPNGLGAPDAAAAMLVNGKILCALSPAPTSANHFPSPTYFYEFNYQTNSFTQVSSPDGGNYSTFVTNMLDLPDGTVLYSTQGNTQYYIYSPGGTPLASGKPTISQVTPNDCVGSSYSIAGTLFNGISEGAGYGDDWQMASNYPIIRLTNGSNVYYARTYNWNSTGIQTGSAVCNAQFTLPAGLPNATYSLVVTANGISSDPVSFSPATGSCIATVYKDCNYGGYAIGLGVGSYTLAQLNALGVPNDDVSSLKVQNGYQVILYADDNFQGASLNVAGNNACLVTNNFNDITTSIIVCAPTTIAPYILVNGGAWQNTNTVSVNTGASVTFGPQPATGGSWSWSGPGGFTSTSRQIVVSNIQTAQSGNYTATYTNATGCTSTEVFTITVVTGGESPYGGNPWPIPGTIQAENYDLGGEGVAYHDVDATNNGGAYRTDGVDIEATTDAGGGYDVGWTEPGEWLNYTVNVATTGSYTLQLRVASINSGKSFHIAMDGANVSGSIAVPNTGGWETWQTVTVNNVSLTSGQHIMQIYMDTDGFNINYLVFNPTAAYSVTIQAEAYSNMFGVQTETTTDVGGGLDVGWIDTGDWMAYYNINFPSSGTYTVQYRVASLNGGQLSMDLNAGSIQLGAANIPATGGWQNWTTITQTINVATAGTYNVGIYAQTGGWNINWFTITKSSGARIGQFDDAAATDVTSNYDLSTGFELSPNPALQELNIQASFSLAGGTVQIVDGIGLEVLRSTYENTSLNVSNLSAGIYTLIYTKDGNKMVKRFIKQ